MQGWTATISHKVTRKRSTKRLKHRGNLFRKSPQFIKKGKDRRSNFVLFVAWSAFIFNKIHHCKAGQPLQGMVLQEKEAQKE